MSHETVKTVKVQPWGKGQGTFVEINENDFNPQKYKLYTNGAVNPVAPPAPVAVGNPPPPAPVASPNASKKAVELANESGLDLASVIGTGNNGKITAEDVESAIEKLTAPESDNK